MSTEGSGAAARPVLRLVRGEPSPEELAALVTVLAARAAAAAAEAPGHPAQVPRVWNDRSRLVRRPLTPGPGAFRASALPG